MVYHMKTTVDLPDEILIEAKKRAAELRRPLREILASALRSELDSTAAPTRGRKIRWVTVKGGLPPDLELSDRARMYEWMSKQSD